MLLLGINFKKFALHFEVLVQVWCGNSNMLVWPRDLMTSKDVQKMRNVAIVE